jgi:hypothetical protein
MTTNLMVRSWLTVALVGGLLVGSSPIATAKENLFQGRHRQLSFSFVHEGELISSQEWPEVSSPNKFTMEIVLRQAGADLTLMVFDLQDQSSEWWLSQVMGFLFDPELTVVSSTSALGYEFYEIQIPGGHGVYAQTEILLLAPGGAYRFTCYRCEDSNAVDSLHRLIDSFLSSSLLMTATERHEATP